MTATTNETRDARILIRFQVYCSFERVEGTASLANISYTGALVEDTTVRPEIGARVKLYVHLKPPCAFEAETPFELTGVVARHTSNGFAVEFEDNHDPEVRRMVDDAVAIIAGPR